MHGILVGNAELLERCRRSGNGKIARNKRNEQFLPKDLSIACRISVGLCPVQFDARIIQEAVDGSRNGNFFGPRVARIDVDSIIDEMMADIVEKGNAILKLWEMASKKNYATYHVEMRFVRQRIGVKSADDRVGELDGVTRRNGLVVEKGREARYNVRFPALTHFQSRIKAKNGTATPKNT